MVPYYGDYAEDATVYIPFNTFSSDDPTASITVTELADADIHIHKNGHVDEISTDGASVVIDFDSITGNHMMTIDTSVDAAYATGSEYAVRLEGIAVNGGTINAFVGSFSIERAGGVLATLKAGTTKVDVETIKTKAITCGAAVTIRADVGAAAAPGAANGMFIGGTNAATTITTGLTANITGNITGNLSGSIGTVAADGITATSMATDSIDAGSIKADAVTKIQNGLATPTNITAATGITVSALDANVITAASINADAITSAKIADNALANEHFAAGALTATEITGAAGCAVSSIGNNVITTLSIADGAITDAKTADDIKVDVNTIKTATVAASSTITFQNGTVPITTDLVAGSGDWTADEKTALKAILGFENSATPIAPTAGVLFDIDADIELTLEDTNELQLAQGNWITATGFATPTNITAGTITTVSGNVDGTVAGVTPAVAGDEMDLIDAPNGTAVTAIQNGLATPTNITAGTITTVTNLTNAPTVGDLTAVMKASVNAEVDTALDTAIGTPTAKSILDYIKRLKFALCNKLEITEASGASEIFDDEDSSFATKAAAFTSLAGVTKREKII